MKPLFWFLVFVVLVLGVPFFLIMLSIEKKHDYCKKHHVSK